MFALLLVACTPDIHPLYDAERTEALTIATDRPSSWQPDLTVAIARDDFEQAIDAALTSALQAQVAPIQTSFLGATAEVRPQLAVDRAKIRPVADCETCLGFNTRLTGRASWTLMGVSGSIPLSVVVGGTFAIEVRDGKYIYAKPKSIKRVGVEITDLSGLRLDPSTLIQSWVEKLLGEKMPTIQILALDTDTIPVRDLRLRTSDEAITVEALSNVPGSLPAATVSAPTSGVRLTLSQSALTGLARRAAYEAGTFSYDTAVDPTSITVDGATFGMDLRVWRLTGRGWWRDYHVDGHLEATDGKVKLTPDTVTELAKSDGAALADPLAALFEGKILETVGDGIDRSLPGHAAQNVGNVKLGAKVRTVTGTLQTLVVDADLKIDGQPTTPTSAQGAGSNR